MTKYFSKELANNTFYLPDGKTPVNFEVFPSNVGVIALDDEKDKPIVEALDEAVSKRKGGIIPLNEQEYQELKKNKGGSRVSVVFQQQPRLQTIRSPSVFPPKSPASPAANGDAPPPEAPKTSTPNLDGPAKTAKRPNTRRRSEVEKKTTANPPQT
jgi:hypothetical protein